jgi:hypothetical protein
MPFKTKKTQSGSAQMRLESSMELSLKYYHFKTASTKTKFTDAQFQSTKMRLEDFAKKEYLWTFSIWHRPTARYYMLGQERTNFLLTVTHSWDYFETYPMAFNLEWDNPANRHLLAQTRDGAYGKIYPNIFKFKSFSHTHGP